MVTHADTTRSPVTSRIAELELRFGKRRPKAADRARLTGFEAITHA